MTTPEPLPQLLIPLHAPEASLENLGGKGLNLVKLAQADFPVPNAFLIPTKCYREYVADNGLKPFIQDSLDGLDTSSPGDLETVAASIRERFEAGTVSGGLASALGIAYPWLGARPVAVRSSATAEDLPDMSFAGQQDTFLNVIGVEALLEAVVKCWGSLWTARAIGYRSRNEISHEDVALSVIVQNMVQSDASGVLFTANPLTGKRDEIVIDATLGLGEALVGGHVEPDHYVVSTSSGATHLEASAMHLIHKFLGSKSLTITGKAEGGVRVQKGDASQQQAIPDEVILQLAEMGQKIAEMYDFPQDIEWAWVANPLGAAHSKESAPHPKNAPRLGEIYILQSRPITSLFPLPEGMPPKPLKAMIGFHVVQGVVEPLTPLGIQTMQNVLTGAALAFGADYSYDNQTAFYTAAERIWINVTSILRHPLGHKAYPTAIKSIDPAVGQIFEKLIDDPRFAPIKKRPKLRTIFNLLKFAIPFWGKIIKYWLNPEKGVQRIFALMDDKVDEMKAFNQNKTIQGQRTSKSKCNAPEPNGNLWDDFKIHLEAWKKGRFIFSDTVIPYGVSAVVASMVPFFGVLQRFSAKIKQPMLYLEIARGLPHNVTTEMDLILWETAQTLRADPASTKIFAQAPAQQLAEDYLHEKLPPAAQVAVFNFMSRYGMRGLGEIDLGRPRWREEPVHVLQTLQSYLGITDPDKAPDIVFARGDEAAQKAAQKFINAVRQLRGGWFKSRLVRLAISRYRALAGLREAPKFFAIRMMGIIRQGLLESGRALVEAGLLENHDDLFFLYAPELEEAAAQKTITNKMRENIKERRETLSREMRRKQLPRVLLSDGRAFFEGFRAADGAENTIVGDPVSPGVVEGAVRVVLNPHETQLLPGEILVCPGTDPAWTPLFLAAGGLVMEVGGMMTHGSVVAREYGIPAVVGVHEATTRLKTGQRVRVDGSSGRVLVMADGE